MSGRLMAGVLEWKLANPSEAWVHLFSGNPSKVVECGSAPLALALLAAFALTLAVMDPDNAWLSLKPPLITHLQQLLPAVWLAASALESV
mmetsp:Transcript_112/g.248  ORF Transcript_112/g.248 Transcript_112/m.248 type:complete len:90 (-) Transcript_112:24-293(-)